VVSCYEFYKKIIHPLGHNAKKKNEEFLEQYASMINLLTQQFSKNFCKDDGGIDWEQLLTSAFFEEDEVYY
jgi:hypothetical protein